jgi:hypothetical protein
LEPPTHEGKPYDKLIQSMTNQAAQSRLYRSELG